MLKSFLNIIVGLLLLATSAVFAAEEPSNKSAAKSWAHDLGEFFQGIVGAGNINSSCRNCEVTQATVQQKTFHVDRSIAWLKNHLKCDNFAYLKSQRENLLRAEKEYGISAAAVACLIATESGWDINADQLDKRSGKFNGSFKGLVQSNTDSFATLRARMAQPPYAQHWQRLNPDISQDIIKSETMHVPQGVILDCPTKRCGGVATTKQKDQIGRASISFVASYLKMNIEKIKSYLEDSPEHGRDVAKKFASSKKTKYLVAAIGYNAGPNAMVGYLPNSAFRNDNGAWRFNILNRRDKIAKTGEVVQYVDWIDSCMNANPAIGPADRTAHLHDKRCFGDARPAGLKKLLSVRKAPVPSCETDPSPNCAGPKALLNPELTPTHIERQRARCPSIPKGKPACPK